MSELMTRDVVLCIDTCASCGITFAVPEHWQKRRREDGATFYCPNGHHLAYGKNTLEKQLERARKREQDAYTWATSVQDQLTSERRSHAATKGHLTRTRRKLADGECPECGKVFKRLATHMSSQHPNFPEESLPEESPK